jgi:hypothetical protein
VEGGDTLISHKNAFLGRRLAADCSMVWCPLVHSLWDAPISAVDQLWMRRTEQRVQRTRHLDGQSHGRRMVDDLMANTTNGFVLMNQALKERAEEHSTTAGTPSASS